MDSRPGPAPALPASCSAYPTSHNPPRGLHCLLRSSECTWLSPTFIQESPLCSLLLFLADWAPPSSSPPSRSIPFVDCLSVWALHDSWSWRDLLTGNPLLVPIEQRVQSELNILNSAKATGSIPTTHASAARQGPK